MVSSRRLGFLEQSLFVGPGRGGRGSARPCGGAGSGQAGSRAAAGSGVCLAGVTAGLGSAAPAPQGGASFLPLGPAGLPVHGDQHAHGSSDGAPACRHSAAPPSGSPDASSPRLCCTHPAPGPCPGPGDGCSPRGRSEPVEWEPHSTSEILTGEELGVD